MTATSITFTRRHALTLVAGLSLGLAGCGGGIPDTIKIGVGTTLSGSSANRGTDVLNGVKMAVAELNRQGYKVDGKNVKLEIVQVDDKGTTEGAKAAAQQLIDQGVTVVFGHLASDVTLAAVPIYQAKNMTLVTTSSAKDITIQGGGNVFRLIASDSAQSRALAAYGSSAVPGARAAVINEDSIYGRGVLEDLIEDAARVKINFVLKDKVDPKARDFAALAQRMKADKVDLLFAVLREPQLLALSEALKAISYTDVTVVLSNPAKTNNVAKADLPFKATYVVSSALDVRDFPQGAKFLGDFRKAYNSDPVWAAHYTYDGMFTIADAIRRAKSVKSEDINRTLKTIDPVTWVTQTMRFGGDGEQTNAAIAVYQAQRGAWVLKMSSAVW